MGSSQEVGLCWVEADGLYNTLRLCERSLSCTLGDRMNRYLSRALKIVYHCGQVVTLGVPYELFDNVRESHYDGLVTLSVREVPLH